MSLNTLQLSIRTYPPREGTETLSRRPYRISQRRPPNSPREGTETFYLLHNNQFSTIRIRTYLPRKGTETIYDVVDCLPRVQYKNLSTSRGDGNSNFLYTKLLIHFSRTPYSPREGTYFLIA